MFGRLGSALKSAKDSAVNFAKSLMPKETVKTIDFLPPAIETRKGVQNVFRDETPGTLMHDAAERNARLSTVMLELPETAAPKPLGKTYGMGIQAWASAEDQPLAVFQQFARESQMDEIPGYEPVDKYYDPISLNAPEKLDGPRVAQSATRVRVSEWDELVSEAVKESKVPAPKQPDRYREVRLRPEDNVGFSLSWLRGRTAAMATAILAATGALAHAATSETEKPQRSYSVEDIVPMTNADAAR